MVAIGTLVVAIGTFSCHVTVGKELLGLLVVKLGSSLLRQFSLVIEFAKPFGSKFMMDVGGGAAIDVKGDTELLERVLNHLVITIHHVLWGDALLAGSHRDGHTVLIASADKQHILLLQSQVTYIDVGWYVNASQMTDVNTTVCIGQCRGHRSPLKFGFYPTFFTLGRTNWFVLLSFIQNVLFCHYSLFIFIICVQRYD